STSSSSSSSFPSLLIDLHSHSTISDGADPPLELIKRAHAAGIKILAITDHDQLRYDEAAISYGLQLGMLIIRGTEISCEWTFTFPEAKRTGSGSGSSTSKRD